MKKLFTILLILTAFLFSLSLSACGGGDGDDDVVEIPPEYASVYTYNDTHHWKRQLNGLGSSEYGEHQNDSGKCYCGYYFHCPNLVFEKKTIREVNSDITGYVLVGYNGLDENAYEHVEIPAYYMPEGSTELVEIIAISANVFSPVANPGIKSIKSVKLNEGLKYIGDGAFSSTDIEEIVIPNSVLGGVNANYKRGEPLGGIFGVFENCSKLKKAVIGSNIVVVGERAFANCVSLERVVFGGFVREIRQTAFDNCTSFKNVVINENLSSIPESSVYSSVDGKYVPLVQVFSHAENVYFEMPKSDYNSLYIDLQVRDERGFIKTITGSFVSPENYVLTSYGLVNGWQGDANLYFEGEWEYDQNGNPKPLI